MLRGLLLLASRSRRLRSAANRHGLRFGAARFVAGTSLDAFVARARAENLLGRRVSCSYLGETTADVRSAARVADDFGAIVERIASERLESTVALKLTHLGLDLGASVAERHVAAIVERAAGHRIFVRIDMEESARVDATLALYRRLRARGLDNVGVVLQSYLRRSPADLAALLPLRPNVRIVKGAYLEPPARAFADRAQIDRAFASLVESALRAGAFVAVATHDERLIDEATSSAERLGLAPHAAFEAQLLLGVRTPLLDALVRRGQPVRVSVPFGTDWYPYLMRRMAEKPSNVALVLRNLR